MRFRLIVLALIGVATHGVCHAQTYLADGFVLDSPALTATVFQQLGPQICSANQGEPHSSFLCGSIRLNASPGQFGAGTDANGDFYEMNVRPSTPAENNLPLGMNGDVYDVVQRSAAGNRVVIRIASERVVCTYGGNGNQECAPGCNGASLVVRTKPLNMMVDAVSGAVYFATFVDKACGTNATDAGGYGIVKVSGLPTVLDLIITYQPAGTVSWVTPRHPETLPSADRFQIFTGNVRDLPNFSLATPASCDFPGGHPPAPGEYEILADPLPAPAAGEASYVIVGVEHAGQRRFGRQRVGGVLTGRDPLRFPPCD